MYGMGTKERETFGSRWGFIMVSAGCAIGLGNVWRFPYITGQYGGAAFILIYLLFLAILGIPVMVMEFTVGRGSRRSVAQSFRVLEAKGAQFHKYSYLGMLGNYMLMMFYTTVCGWMINYFVKMATGRMDSLSPEEVGGVFGEMLGSWKEMLFWMIVAVCLAFFICSLGLVKGVERVTKWMMSALLILMGVMVVRAVTLPGSMEGLRFYLVPDFHAMFADFGKVAFAALGQSFFTLSIGIGAMAIFGSYLPREKSITGEAVRITGLDTLVAIMAGMIIIPSCFSFGISPDAGPGLVFITLPNVFAKMPLGQLWGSLFFLFMSFAALSTVVAVFENILAFGMDLWGWQRSKAVRINLVAIIALSLPCVLGFNLWSGVMPFGEGSGIMDLEDFIVSNNLLPLGSLVYVTFCTRRYGWGWDNFLAEADRGEGMRFPRIRGYVTYVLPLIILVVYVKGYWDFFIGFGLSPWLGLGIAAVILAGFAHIIFYRQKDTADSL